MDTIICIPTKRPPPVVTLGSYATSPFSVLVVADPDVYDQHYEFYRDLPGVTVVRGVKGLGAQCAECYRQAAKAGYPYWFKLDDDLPPRTFVHMDGTFPDLNYVINQARDCLFQLGVTLVGLHNGANRSWMKEGFASTYGLVHGGANLSISALDPSPYMNEELVRGEDVWRTCAHREGSNGVVGRLSFIGFDKSKSTAVAGHSSTTTNQDAINKSRDTILARFPNTVTCNGTRFIDNGRFEIPNWRMKKG